MQCVAVAVAAAPAPACLYCCRQLVLLLLLCVVVVVVGPLEKLHSVCVVSWLRLLQLAGRAIRKQLKVNKPSNQQLDQESNSDSGKDSAEIALWISSGLEPASSFSTRCQPTADYYHCL